MRRNKRDGCVGQSLALLLCGLGALVATVRSGRFDDIQFFVKKRDIAVSVAEREMSLTARRKAAIEEMLGMMLQDPDSAHFKYELLEDDTLRVRVCSKDAAGDFMVQSYDVTFTPRSILASNVVGLL